MSSLTGQNEYAIPHTLTDSVANFVPVTAGRERLWHLQDLTSQSPSHSARHYFIHKCSDNEKLRLLSFTL